MAVIAKATIRVDGLALARAISKLADTMEPQYRKAFLTAVKAAAQSPAMDMLVQKITTSPALVLGAELEQAIQGLHMDFAKLQGLAFDAYTAGTKAAGNEVAYDMAFDVTNPRALAFAQAHAGSMIAATSQTQETIRQLVVKAFTDGIPPANLAAMIRSHIGLLPQHSTAVYKYEQTLLATGTKPCVASNLAKSYADRLLWWRANTIARTEIMTALNQGQHDYWLQSMDAGFIDSDGTMREWIAYGGDKRTCALCRGLNGHQATMDGYFDGTYRMPPAHPACRCAIGLVFQPGPSYAEQKQALKAKLRAEGLAKYNHAHDARGRFSSHAGGIGALATVTEPQRGTQLPREGILGLAPGARWGYIKDHKRDLTTHGAGGGVSESFWINDPVTGDKMLVKDGAHFSHHDALSEVVASQFLSGTSLIGQEAHQGSQAHAEASGWVLIPHLSTNPRVREAIGVGWANPSKDVTGSNLKVKMMDFVTLNSDRHSGNVFKVIGKDGKYQVAAIDNSAVFGGRKKAQFQPENRPANESLKAWRSDWNHPSNNDFRYAGATAKALGRKQTTKVYNATVKEMHQGAARMRDPKFLATLPKDGQAKAKQWADYADARANALHAHRKQNIDWLLSSDPTVSLPPKHPVAKPQPKHTGLTDTMWKPANEPVVNVAPKKNAKIPPWLTKWTIGGGE